MPTGSRKSERGPVRHLRHRSSEFRFSARKPAYLKKPNNARLLTMLRASQAFVRGFGLDPTGDEVVDRGR